MSPQRARLLVPLLSVLVGLALGEALLRGVFRYAPQVDLDIYRRDEAGNLALIPHLTKRHVTPLWDVHVRTNAEGRRDEPGDEAPILGLGDSFAFGWGVEESEGLYRRLENKLGQKILNAAVPGTGPPDQARLLETVFADAAPEMVLVALYVGNDFHDAAAGGADQFEVDGGLLVRKTDEGGAGAWGWARRLRVLQLARALQLRWFASGPGGQEREWDAWMRRFAEVHRRDAPERLFEATAEALDRIRSWCDGRGARLAVILIPRSWQLDDAELAAMTAELGIDPEELDLDRPQKFLLAWGAERGAEVIDLLPAFRRVAAEYPRPRLYHTPDAHWTADGHALAARSVAARLRRSP